MKEHNISAAIVVKFILRILIGAFFITTAILKLLSLDSFEIYIYSFNIFSFNLCAIIARLVIAAELLVGAFLIAKILYKPTWWLTLLMLVGFTFFLVYVAIFRQDSNCHCMGDLVELNPAYSIIKNLITIVLLFFIRKEEDYQFKGKKAVGIVLAVLALGVPFILFPTDATYNLFKKSDNNVNEKSFEQFMQNSVAQSLNIQEGNYVLGYLASGCKYCKLSAKKINTMVENNQLDTNKVIFIIWGGDESIQKFKEETDATHFRYAKISPIEAIQLVSGQFPTYVLVKDGKPVEAMDIRGLNDNKIRSFLIE
ncbi:MAG: DoxX family protein [Bacteroidales bacterium]|nr:DoxX family protein [Bacteroidales bacterium]